MTKATSHKNLKIRVSGYSDWNQSPKSERVWLTNSMTALGQFAYVNPLKNIKHWSSTKNSYVKCWAALDQDCFHCQNGIKKSTDYVYGIYVSKGNTDIKYLSVNLTTHTHLQKIFSTLFDDNKNPCDIVFKISYKQLTNMNGKKYNGYDIVESDEEMYVKEIFRPSPLDAYQNIVKDFKWVVPEELVIKLVDYDQKPMSLIDLFLLIKETYPIINDKDAKKYSIRLIENGLLDVKKAKEYRH